MRGALYCQWRRFGISFSDAVLQYSYFKFMQAGAGWLAGWLKYSHKEFSVIKAEADQKITLGTNWVDQKQKFLQFHF